MRKLWFRYVRMVHDRCMTRDPEPQHSVAFWQNRLFVSTMIALLPLAFLTTIPGIVHSLFKGEYRLALFDGLSMMLVFALGLMRPISVLYRKYALVALAYFVGIYLLTFPLMWGAGLLFLLIACVFALLILPLRWAFTWSYLNTLIVATMTLGLALSWSFLPEMAYLDWLAIAINLVLLSFMASWVLPTLYQGIELTFGRQAALTQKLQQQKEQREKAMALLESKNREVQQFVYFASHDLQEPLRMVNGFVRKLEDRNAGQWDEKSRQYFHFARDGGERMQRIIQDLLALSRSGQAAEAELSWVDIKEVLASLRKLMTEEFTNTGAELSYGDLEPVKIQPAVLEKTLQNLISNALKYRHPERRLKIDVQQEKLENQWKIGVADTAMGVPEGAEERIFEVFYRHAPHSAVKGTGIGLAIVKRSLESIGGQVWAEARPGGGSVFYFTFPR